MGVSEFDCVEGTLRTQVQKSGYRLELNSVLLLKYTNLKGENRPQYMTGDSERITKHLETTKETQVARHR